MSDKAISQIRKDYSQQSMAIEEVSTDAVAQFEKWFDEARKAEAVEVNAMVLSTVKADGRPSSRVVLLKGVENGAFLFYTNYESDKGRELARHNAVALNFFWPELERQVRIEGRCEKVAPEVSDEYFASRPRASQIGAWTSPQSEEIADRKALEDLQAAVENRFAGQEVPRPPHWGGYAVHPDMIEYWQGRPGRLHDRIRFEKEGQGWRRKRLAP